MGCEALVVMGPPNIANAENGISHSCRWKFHDQMGFGNPGTAVNPLRGVRVNEWKFFWLHSQIGFPPPFVVLMGFSLTQTSLTVNSL